MFIRLSKTSFLIAVLKLLVIAGLLWTFYTLKEFTYVLGVNFLGADTNNRCLVDYISIQFEYTHQEMMSDKLIKNYMMILSSLQIDVLYFFVSIYW